MISLIREIPDQLEHGWEAACKVVQKIPNKQPSLFVICGMGGSGISGDLLRGLLLKRSPIPIEVVKDYVLTRWIDQSSFAAAISYSGNTEETLSMWSELASRNTPRLAISSGGKLTEIAKKESVPVIPVPSGYPPRASIGYLFTSLLSLAHRLNLYPEAKADLSRAIELIRSRITIWEDEARSLAKSLMNGFPVVYALETCFTPLAYRMVCEINENSKMLAHWHVYSEMNHNEINGYEGGVGDDISLVILDPGEGITNPRNRKRLGIIDSILPSSIPRFTITAEGSSLLERMFSVLIRGDITSVVLAELQGIDPVPVTTIERLKKELS